MERRQDDPPLVYDVHVFCCVNRRPETHRRGCCASKNSQQLCDYMCRRAILHGLGHRVRVNAAGCLNVCQYGPALVIYPEGVWYRYDNEDDIDEILSQHVVRGTRVQRLLLYIDPETTMS